MADDNDVVTYERRGSVAVVTMNRPEYANAQNSAMTYALDGAFYRAVEDDDVSVVVLTGAGKHFSAGHDIPAHREPVVGPRRQAGCGGPVRARVRGVRRHVPALARAAEADDRHGARRLRGGRPDARLVL
jgi:enoyl-CoA hydratase/carnithine racemase